MLPSAVEISVIEQVQDLPVELILRFPWIVNRGRSTTFVTQCAQPRGATPFASGRIAIYLVAGIVPRQSKVQRCRSSYRPVEGNTVWGPVSRGVSRAATVPFEFLNRSRATEPLKPERRERERNSSRRTSRDRKCNNRGYSMVLHRAGMVSGRFYLASKSQRRNKARSIVSTCSWTI